MDLVIAGLGRMGANMARRLHAAGHHVVAYNRSEEKVRDIMSEGLDGAFSAADAVAKLHDARLELADNDPGLRVSIVFERPVEAIPPGA